jgi:hypothetical protein
LSEASQLASTGACRRRLANQDKTRLCLRCPRLDHLTLGRPLLLAARWPGVTGLTSYLAGCLSPTSQRCGSHIADLLEVFYEPCQASFSSRFHARFVRLSAIWSGGSALRTRLCVSPCQCAVATVYPLGDCYSPKLETRLSYLTRLGTVSNRSLPLSSFFALLTVREHRQRTW